MNMLLQTPTPPAAGSRRPWTVEDVALLPEELAGGSVRYELWAGELQLMVPPGPEHSRTQLQVGRVLADAVEPHGGVVGTEFGVILSRNPDTLVSADVAVYLASTQELRESSSGYYETPPDIAVEVRSPGDTGPELARKAGAYLAASVRAAWVLDPVRRTLTIYRTGVAPVALAEGDTIDLTEFVPDTRLIVRDLFVRQRRALPSADTGGAGS